MGIKERSWDQTNMQTWTTLNPTLLPPQSQGQVQPHKIGKPGWNTAIVMMCWLHSLKLKCSPLKISRRDPKGSDRIECSSILVRCAPMIVRPVSFMVFHHWTSFFKVTELVSPNKDHLRPKKVTDGSKTRSRLEEYGRYFFQMANNGT